MKLFSIYFSTLTFLMIELIGLIKGEPVGSILLKSVGTFLVLFFLGNALAKLFEPVKNKEQASALDEQSSGAGPKAVTSKDTGAAPALEKPAQTADAQTEMYKQEAIRLAREKPKEVAQLFEALIEK